MVIWWHPNSSKLYSSNPKHGRLWYGDDYLDHAIVCSDDADYLVWRRGHAVVV